MPQQAQEPTSPARKATPYSAHADYGNKSNALPRIAINTGQRKTTWPEDRRGAGICRHRLDKPAAKTRPAQTACHPGGQNDIALRAIGAAVLASLRCGRAQAPASRRRHETSSLSRDDRLNHATAGNRQGSPGRGTRRRSCASGPEPGRKLR